ncbi:MAG: response regulator [Saprospiraceae bacterium]
MLVDDESSAITTLRGMIEKFCPNVEIIGICQDYHSAIDLVHKQTPDLVFLDIQISPIHSGFDFLEQTRDRSFGTIFTTAYAEYAVKAINRFQPWSYLVKPFSVADLLDAVKVANQKLQEIHQQKAAQSLDQKFEFTDIFKKHHLIKARDIKYLQINDSIISLYFCVEIQRAN